VLLLKNRKVCQPGEQDGSGFNALLAFHSGGGHRTPDLAREPNDGLAELVVEHDRFLAFGASLPMNNPEAALRELVRAIDELGATGVQLHSNVAGKPLDAPEFRPLFDAIAERDATIWLHPSRDASFSDYQTEDRSLYEIWWTFGWTYDNVAARLLGPVRPVA